MNRTEHHGLPQWEEQDRILRTDFNAANAAVDAALHALDENTAELLTDTWRKEETLAAATRLLYGLAAGAAPDAAFARLAAAQPWTLIQEYRAAGAYTWTAPDLFSGADYRLGVYMVGGGGSGAAGVRRAVSGGAAGYGKNIELTVTPGQQIAAVVGSGGSSVSVSSSGGSFRGNSGGTTAFNGVTVSGGRGGKGGGSEFAADGVDGGQGSDASPSTSETACVYGSCGTKDACYYATGGSYMETYCGSGGRSQSPRESQNRFDPSMITLCAGGGAKDSGVQTVAAMPDGTKGGNGVKAGEAVTAQSATGNGNGGGAAYGVNAAATRSGAGSPGMILIYAKAV